MLGFRREDCEVLYLESSGGVKQLEGRLDRLKILSSDPSQGGIPKIILVIWDLPNEVADQFFDYFEDSQRFDLSGFSVIGVFSPDNHDARTEMDYFWTKHRDTFVFKYHYRPTSDDEIFVLIW